MSKLEQTLLKFKQRRKYAICYTPNSPKIHQNMSNIILLIVCNPCNNRNEQVERFKEVKSLDNDIKIYFNGKEPEKGVTQYLSESKIDLKDIKEIGTYNPKITNQPPEFKTYYMNHPYVPPESDQNACRALYLYDSLPIHMQKHKKMALIARENDTTILEMNKHWRCINKNQKCWRDEDENRDD